MKPIYLEIQAFGPFVEKQVIDFAPLYENQIFLIHGPTGAGKSTLFDAICVALYGKSTGLREVEQMRSHYAKEDSPTEIRFVFERQGKLYQAFRQLRISKKGDLEKKYSFGAVSKDAETKQYEYIETPATKVKDIEEQVKRLIGFDEKQFKQIIILPQGKFQEILLSESKEKQKTLEQLFDTQLYQDLTKRLQDEAKKRKDIFEELQKSRQAFVATLPPDAAEAENLAQYLAAEKEALAVEEQVLLALHKRKEAAEQAFQQAQSLYQYHQECSTKESALHKHLLQEQAYQQKIQRLHRAEKAAPLQRNIEELQRIEERLKEKKTLLAEAQSHLQKAIQEESRLKEEEEALQAQAPAMQQKAEEMKRLEALIPTLAEQRNLRASLSQVTEALEALFEQQKNQQAALEQKEKAIAQMRQEYEQIGAYQLQLEKIKNQLKEAATKRISKEKYDDLLAQYQKQKQAADALQKAESKAAEDYLRLHDRLMQMEKQWRKNQAALLGQQLVAGQPCPVCGALEHPHPAQAAEENMVSEAEIELQKAQKDQAEQKKENLQKQLAQANQHLQSIESEGKAIAEMLGKEWKERTVQDIKIIIKIYEEESQGLEQQITRLEKLKSQAQAEEASIAEVKARIEQIKEEIQEQKEQKIGIEKSLENLLVATHQSAEDEAALQAQINLLQKEKKQYEQRCQQNQEDIRQNFNKKSALNAQIQSLTESTQELHQRAAQEREEIQQQSQKQGFDSLEALQAALLSEADTEALKAETLSWEKEKEKLNTEIQQLKSYIQGQAAPDLPVLQEELRSLQTEYRQAQEQQAIRKSSLQQVEATAQRIAEKEAEIKLKEEEWQYYDLLKRTATGEGALKQSLVAFVLGAFLEEVLFYTNKRLALLSQGRYQLLLAYEMEDGRKKSGLDFEVFDSYNGQKRSVKTLSGGEIFFSSLALALGMTDAVSARSGGIRLEAMFIDEGFGSLDSETLDLAINTLLDLEGAHRLIGIISHVSELKERIFGARIEVRKSKQGSSLRLA